MRLNKKRQTQLEPLRFMKAMSIFKNLGLDPVDLRANKQQCINFQFKGHNVSYFPYSGWATGKTIKDGRGLQNLLKQLTK